jgi:prolipoprotein diacylglyceryltransferase
MSLTPLHRAFRTIVRWMGRMMLVGFGVGIMLMLMRAVPFAESTSGAESVWFYAVWIPPMVMLGAFSGLALGAIAAIVDELSLFRPLSRDDR